MDMHYHDFDPAENDRGETPYTERMMQMIYGFAISQIVHAFASHGVADELAAGPATAEEIATRCSANSDGMFRLLRAGVSLGLVAADGEARFAGTPLLRTLERRAPGSLWGLSVLLASRGTWAPWGNLVDAVRTGEKQAVQTLGKDLWQYYEEEPAEAEAFLHAMRAISDGVGPRLARVIDTRAFSVAADIGGSSGALVKELMAANSALHGIVFDLPDVIAVAEEQNGPQPRLSFMAGNFLDSVPEADLYLLKHVLHDWDDEACIVVLKNCRRALRPGGRIMVLEMVIGEGGTGVRKARPLIQDLSMLVLLGARERTLAEYKALFAAAGLRLAQTTLVPAPLGPTTVMEAIIA